MLKFFFALVVLVAFAWFGTTVPLGPHTLFGHLQAISHTKESQELVEGTKQSAKPLVDDVRRRIAGEATPDAGPPQEKVTDGERRRLRRLIGAADQTASAHR